MREIISFFSEVRGEISKVTWPSRNEVIKLTVIVFAVSIIVGAYVGGLDYLFTKVLEKLISR